VNSPLPTCRATVTANVAHVNSVALTAQSLDRCQLAESPCKCAGEEQPQRQDYTGYAQGINCLQLRVVTGVTSSPGSLDVKVRMQGLDDRNRFVMGGNQVSTAGR
jgi:hypothetical protein